MDESCFLKAASLCEKSGKDRFHIVPFLFPLPDSAGFAFALAHIPQQASPSTPLPLIETILEAWSRSYRTDKSLQNQFEKLLSELNEACANEVRAGVWQLPIESCSLLVGCAQGDTISLSGTGNAISVLFLHHKPDTHHYHVFNLARSLETSQALPSWEKPFALVLDGELHHGDVLCISSPDLAATIEPEELHPCLTTLPPSSSVSRIRQYFPATTSLAVIVLTSEEHSLSSSQDLPAEESLMGWERTQETTEELLEDEGVNLKKILKRSWSSLLEKSGKASFHKQGQASLIGRGIETVGTIAGGIIDLLKRADPDRRLTSQKVRRDFPVRGMKAWWLHLPRKTRLVSQVSIVVMILALAGFGSWRVKTMQAQELAAYRSNLQSITDLLNRAESTAIYDRARARSLLEEAERKLSALQEPSETELASKTAVEQTAKDVSQKLRGLVRVEATTVVGRLPETNDPLRALLKQGGEWVALSDNRGVYRLKSDTGTFQKLETKIGEVGVPIAASAGTNSVVIADSRPGLAIYTAKDSAWKPSLAASGKEIRDLFVYNDRVYFIAPTDTGDVSVYRANQSSTDLGTPSPWIRTKTSDLSDAVSLTIDSNVYVLKKNGDIVRFASGDETAWKHGAVDPVLSATDAIFTAVSSDYLTVLEKSSGRLVVFNKDTGEFVRQYEHDVLKRANDLVLDDELKSAFILTDNSLESFPLNHVQ